MSELPDLDPAAMDRLSRLGGTAFRAKMIELFLAYGGEKLSEARKGFEVGDLGAVEKAVHPIKSSAGNVGAARMQRLATETELRAREADAEAVRTLLNELEQAYRAVQPLLVEWKDPAGEGGPKAG